jgi:hypothetical protein
MSRASSKVRKFAERLTAYETRGNEPAETAGPPGFRTCEKLRAHLATSVGNVGSRELVSCAFARASAEVPWLRAVQVKADGQLEGLEALHAQRSQEERSEGEVVLLAQLLGLLVAFIGERLTFRQVREVWPQIPLNDLDFGRGGKDEKTR